MEPWYKFILYGTYDGFSRSTLGDDNLYLILENGEKVEIPRCFVKNASDFVEKDKLKLKDVIARIKNIDLDSQELWLNEILNKLGSDYGSLKYRAGYEQGRFDCAMERDKVTVPQYVADWIEKGKKELSLRDLMSSSYTSTEVGNWLGELDEDGGFKNQETFARAVLDGYTVEKEKRYYVRFKWIEESYSYLTLIKHLNAWTLSSIKLDKKFRTEHTKKQLEEAGFGWVFDCEGIEIEEVEE
ncbi:DUF1642 domain-containing protein [Streptococcus parasanguinis]|nr:DUF1642 domain-containing protein [Streptococcus parasanguinis]MCP9067498.1 DUF1642 domain-containing protein [Streptococcus parasanguinis]